MSRLCCWWAVLAVLARLALAVHVGSLGGSLDLDTSYESQRLLYDIIYTQFSARPPTDGTLTLSLQYVGSDVLCAGRAAAFPASSAVYVNFTGTTCRVSKIAALVARANGAAVLIDAANLPAHEIGEFARQSPDGSDEFAEALLIVSAMVHGSAAFETNTAGTPITLFQRRMPAAQVAALVAVYQLLAGQFWSFSAGGQSANGRMWEPFREDADPCAHHWERVVCSPAGDVSQLLLFQFNLIGLLPDELGNLTRLNWLNMAQNKIGGIVPSSLAQLGELSYLSLAFNDLVGTFPAGFRSLGALTTLDVSGNLLSGDLAAFPHPPFVEIFRVSSNALTGSLPPAIVFSRAVELAFSANQLTGTIPSEYFAMADLMELELANNKLSGEVAGGSLASVLEVVNLSANRLTRIGALELPRLRTLFLCCNMLDGTSRGGFAASNWPDLDELDLSYNSFSGEFNSTAFVPQSVRRLVLTGNQLISITTLPGAVTELVVANNKLESLEGLLAAFPQPELVTEIRAAANELRYRYKLFPMSLFAKFSVLKTLDVKSNKLSGELLVARADTDALPSLGYLDFSNNNFSGLVSDTLGRLPALWFLDLSANVQLRRQHGPGKLVPSFAMPDYNEVDLDALEGAACPTFRNPRTRLLVKLDHSYHSYRLCTCRDGFYNTTTGCKACLAHAQCVGHPTSPRASYIQADPGYYPFSSLVAFDNIYYVAFNTSSGDVANRIGFDGETSGSNPFLTGFATITGLVDSGLSSGAFTTSSSAGTSTTTSATTGGRRLSQLALDRAGESAIRVPGVMAPCRFGAVRESDDDNPCSPAGTLQNNTIFSCRIGSSGRLCSACDSGYFNRNGKCVRCSASAGAFPAVFAVGVFCLVTAALALVAVRDTVPPIERLQTPMYYTDQRRLREAKAAATVSPTEHDVELASDRSNSEQGEISSHSDRAEPHASASAHRRHPADQLQGDGDRDRDHADSHAVPSGIRARLFAVLKSRRFRSMRLFLISLVAISINFAQTLTITMSDATLPSSVLPVFQSARLFESRSDNSGIGFECIDLLKSYRARYLLMMMLPAVTLLFVFVAFTVKFVLTYRKRRAEAEARRARNLDELLENARGEPKDMEEANVFLETQLRVIALPKSALQVYAYQCVYFTLVIMNYALMPLATFVLNAFPCDTDEVTGATYIRNLPYLDCSYLSPVERLIPVLAYTIAPGAALVGGMILIEIRPHSYFAHTTFGLWFDAFKSKHRYYALYFLARKLTMAIVVALVESNTIYRDVILIAVFVLSAFSVFITRPFFFDQTNTVDVVAHCALVVCYVVGMVMSSNVSRSESIVAAIFWIGPAIAFAALVTYYFVSAFYRVVVLGEWHDQHLRDAAVTRVQYLNRMWLQHGVSPVVADA